MHGCMDTYVDRLKTWIMIDNDEMRYPHISSSKSQHTYMQTNMQNKSVKMEQ